MSVSVNTHIDDEKPDMLRTSPQQFFLSCKRATGTEAALHLRILSNHAALIPEDLAQDAFDFFLSYIRSSKMAAVKNLSSANNMLMSLRGIGRMQVFFQSNEALRTSFRVALPEILKCMQALLDRLPVRHHGSSSESEQTDFNIWISEFFLCLVGNQHLISILSKNMSSVGAVVTKLWLEDSKSLQSSENVSYASSSSLALYVVILGQERVEAILKLMMKESRPKGGASYVAKLALRRLREAACTQVIETKPGLVVAHALNLMVLCEEAAVFQEIMRLEGLPTLIKAVVDLTDSISISDLASKDETFNAQTFIYYLFNQLKTLLSMTDDAVKPFAQVVQEGIFRIFLRFCASQGMEKVNERIILLITKTIFHFLPLMLVHSTVLAAVTTEMRTLSDHESFCGKKLGSFAGEWRSLKDAILVHYARRRYMDVILAPAKERRYCDTCQKVDLKNAFQCCATCKNAFYCSKECQVVGWKEKNHKKLCKDLVGSRSKDIAGSKPISPIAAIEVKRHMLGLKERLDKLKIPLSKAVFTLEWTKFPPSPPVFKVQSVETLMKELIRERDMTEIALLQEVSRTTATAPKDMLGITRMIVYTGSGSRTSFSPIHVTEFMSSNLPRPSKVGFARQTFRDENGDELACIWDEVDEILQRLNLNSDGRWTIASGGKSVHIFDLIEEVMKEPSFPIPANIRLAQQFGEFAI